MNCGWCGCDDIDYETVDNGLGLQQVGPGICCRCGAVEISAWTDPTTISPIDAKRGWYAGIDSLMTVGPPTPVENKMVYRAFLYDAGTRELVSWFDMTHVAYVEVTLRQSMFRTNCGLVFETCVEPTTDMITCLACICEEAV